MPKLGKRPYVPDIRDITFAAIKPEAPLPMPEPPARFGHGGAFKDWRMLGNDKYGDCVFAGGAHETMLTAKLGGHVAAFNDTGVLSDYSAVTGFQPNDPYSDQGADVRETLGYRRHTGLVDSSGHRHKIGAYVSLNAGDWTELWQAVFIFTAVGMGFQFPDTAMDQFDAGEPWDIVPNAQIDGGHYVPVVGRSSVGVGACVTWAKRQPFTRKFYETYADEAWAIIYPEELKVGHTEHGFSLATLRTYLGQL
jgi:hypothetical protein